MSSTDDPRGDEERGEQPIDESVLPPGPRRSTYTPPVTRQPPSPTMDDDDLADVIAANLASATGAINVIYQLDDVTPSVPMGAPIEQMAAPHPDDRILPANAKPADAPAAAPEPEPAVEAAAMPSPDATAVPVDLPPPPEFAAPFTEPTFTEPAFEEPAASEAPFTEPTFTEPTPTEPTFAEPLVAEPTPVDPTPSEPAFTEPPAQWGIDEETTTRAPQPVSVEPEYDDTDEPAASDPAPAAWEPEPWEPTSSWEPETWNPEAPDGFGNSYDADETAASEPEAPVFELPVVPPAPPTEPFDQAAFLAASAAPAGQRPWIPERQSLRDDELASLLENGAEHPGGTLGMMDELERQMQLREDETREFSEWQESMLAVGTPEALAAVQEVLPDFSDIVAPSTSSIPVQEVPTQSEPVQPAPITAPSIFDAPPPIFDAPPPSFDAPPPAFNEPAVFDAPPPAFDAPVFDAPPPVFDAPPPVFDAPPPAFDAPPVFDAPPPAYEPEPAVEPEPVYEPAPEPVDEPVYEAEPVDESYYEPEQPSAPIDEMPAFATPVEPPPLVEPPDMPDAWDIPSGNAIPGSEADPVFIEPLQVEQIADPQPLVEPSPFGGEPFVDRVFTGPVTVVTGSVPVAGQDFDVDGDDPVDPTDQVPTSFDDLLGPNPGTAPIEPILSPRIPEDEVVLGEEQQLERPRVFSLESAGLEPTPEEQRVGRAARMFWMWFAANSSIVSIAFGAVLFSLGLSLRQAIVGILAGVAISFLPLGLGTLAGKRSGQPTMVVSRAAFGVVGNGIPAFVAFLSRVFWGSAMLWLLATGVNEILVGAELTGGNDPGLLTIIVLATGFVVSLVVALFGYGMLAKFQLVVSIISGILVIGVIALTASYVDISTALTNPDGSWMLAGTVAVLVFSFIGLLWANSASDLARYQRPGSSGAGAMLWTTFGAAVPTFVLISYGALLAASNEQIADGLLTLPFDTIGRLLPTWYPVPLIAAVSLSLISGIIVTMYSGGFALKAIGLSLSRPVAAIVTGVLVAGGAFLLTTMSTDLTMLFRDLATTLAVPVAAWAGIFAADTMIRNRRYHSDSLLRSGGVYPTVNWVNLPAFLIITALGFGLTTATVAGLDWQGFLWPLLGIELDSPLAGTDLGVFAALLLGLLVPIVSGIPAIRRQESATPPQN